MNERVRVDRWRAAFDKQVDDLRRTPFEWGVHDCGVGLVGSLTKAIVGEDKASKFKGRYKTASGAYRVVKSEGFENLGDLAASILTEIHPSEVQIGDIAAIPDGGALKYALGVVNGDRVLVLREEGLGTVDLSETKRAFRVG